MARIPFLTLSHDGTFSYFMIVTAMPSWVPVPLKTLCQMYPKFHFLLKEAM